MRLSYCTAELYSVLAFNWHLCVYVVMNIRVGLLLLRWSLINVSYIVRSAISATSVLFVLFLSYIQIHVNCK